MNRGWQVWITNALKAACESIFLYNAPQYQTEHSFVKAPQWHTLQELKKNWKILLANEQGVTSLDYYRSKGSVRKYFSV